MKTVMFLPDTFFILEEDMIRDRITGEAGIESFDKRLQQT